MTEKTWSAGEKVTASNMNTYATHTGSAFNTWTPVVVQSNTPTLTVSSAVYYRSGRFIGFNAVVTITSAGTASNAVTVSLPITAKGGYSTRSIFGWGLLEDTSGPFVYTGALVYASTTTVSILNATSNPYNVLGAAGFTAALANTDVISVHGWYEAASG